MSPTATPPLLSQDQSSLISFTPMHSLGEEGELIETIQQLSLARSVEMIQAIVRHTARRLTGADGATFVLRDGDLCHYADEDAIEPLWKGQRFPMSACISGWVMRHREPAMLPDIYADDRIPARRLPPDVRQEPADGSHPPARSDRGHRQLLGRAPRAVGSPGDAAPGAGRLDGGGDGERAHDRGARGGAPRQPHAAGDRRRVPRRRHPPAPPARGAHGDGARTDAGHGRRARRRSSARPRSCTTSASWPSRTRSCSSATGWPTTSSRSSRRTRPRAPRS